MMKVLDLNLKSNTMRIRIFFIIILIPFIFSCKKYKYEAEDLYGSYYINRYMVDDFDSTFYFEQFKSSYVAFSPNSDIMDFINRRIDTNSNFYINIRAYWVFLNENESLNIDISRFEGNYENWIQHGPLSIGANHNWDILNLDENELILLTNYHKKNYKLNLSRK